LILKLGSGETPEGLEATGGRARQPRIKCRWLATADEAGKILRECYRLCQCRRLLGQLRKPVVILRRRPLRGPED
jgi:hypothetical protein